MGAKKKKSTEQSAQDGPVQMGQRCAGVAFVRARRKHFPEKPLGLPRVPSGIIASIVSFLSLKPTQRQSTLATRNTYSPESPDRD